MIFKNIFNKKRVSEVDDNSQVDINRIKELKQLKKLANNYLSIYEDRSTHDKEK